MWGMFGVWLLLTCVGWYFGFSSGENLIDYALPAEMGDIGARIVAALWFPATAVAFVMESDIGDGFSHWPFVAGWYGLGALFLFFAARKKGF